MPQTRELFYSHNLGELGRRGRPNQKGKDRPNSWAAELTAQDACPLFWPPSHFLRIWKDAKRESTCASPAQIYQEEDSRRLGSMSCPCLGGSTTGSESPVLGRSRTHMGLARHENWMSKGIPPR